MRGKFRTYQELIQLETFEERFEYLRLAGTPGYITFGSHRLLNQMLYKSPIWDSVRQRVILRDNGCDLAIPDRPICPRDHEDWKKRKDILIVHHLNPITIEQVTKNDPAVYDLNNLVCVSHKTHNAIHYGDGSNLMPSQLIKRRPGDTKLW